ncbi:MAG: VWA domain-containing protein [Candidatus Obscuribacterales bacterium]|nr:VWA domain-containing protein [Candidatus Obscuribacterales bacterium]
MSQEQDADERLRRWRLLLGGSQCDGTGASLGSDEINMDRCLTALYDAQLEDERQGKTRSAGLGASAPNVARWLGDIRKYFPVSVVKVMQQDALERLNIQRMLFEPELLESVEADVHLVATLMSLASAMPNRTKESARMVVRKVVDELLKKLASPTRQAVIGSLNRSQRNLRPRYNEIDWQKTIRANLRHYQSRFQTVIPERRIGFGRKRSSLKDIILCVDQSGSMAASVVYSSVFAAVLASIPALSTSMIVFDTAVVDLSEKLQDPVEILFGTQLGGGTDINRALSYCHSLIRRPSDTIFVLISDLYEGGNRGEMLKSMARIAGSGVTAVALLSLNDSGAPSYDHENAAAFASMDVPSFACTPDLFPELMAAALSKRDLQQWAAAHDLTTSRAERV